MAHWTDDPAFDDALEIFDGRRFYGDDWRRLQRLREDAPIARVIGVAGTCHHAPAIARAVQQGVGEAALVPEPENPHDAKAVRVLLDGAHHVGHLPRGSAVPTTRVRVCHIGPGVWLAVDE